MLALAHAYTLRFMLLSIVSLNVETSIAAQDKDDGPNAFTAYAFSLVSNTLNKHCQ